MIYKSNRLQFKKFEPTDLKDYLTLNTNSNVMQFITGDPMTEEQARERFKKHTSLVPEGQPLGFFRAALKESDTFIGLAKIAPFKNGHLETGYALLPEFWGKGYATEILRWTIEHAKKQRGITHLTALVNPDHEGSKKVLTKSNFEFAKSETYENLPTHFFELNIT